MVEEQLYPNLQAEVEKKVNENLDGFDSQLISAAAVEGALKLFPLKLDYLRDLLFKKTPPVANNRKKIADYFVKQIKEEAVTYILEHYTDDFGQDFATLIKPWEEGLTIRMNYETATLANAIDWDRTAYHAAEGDAVSQFAGTEGDPAVVSFPYRAATQLNKLDYVELLMQNGTEESVSLKLTGHGTSLPEESNCRYRAVCNPVKTLTRISTGEVKKYGDITEILKDEIAADENVKSTFEDDDFMNALHVDFFNSLIYNYNGKYGESMSKLAFFFDIPNLAIGDGNAYKEDQIVITPDWTVTKQ